MMFHEPIRTEWSFPDGPYRMDDTDSIWSVDRVLYLDKPPGQFGDFLKKISHNDTAYAIVLDGLKYFAMSNPRRWREFLSTLATFKNLTCLVLSSRESGGCLPLAAVINLIKSIPNLTRLHIHETVLIGITPSSVDNMAACIPNSNLEVLEWCGDITPEYLRHEIEKIACAVCQSRISSLRWEMGSLVSEHVDLYKLFSARHLKHLSIQESTITAIQRNTQCISKSRLEKSYLETLTITHRLEKGMSLVATCPPYNTLLMALAKSNIDTIVLNLHLPFTLLKCDSIARAVVKAFSAPGCQKRTVKIRMDGAGCSLDSDSYAALTQALKSNPLLHLDVQMGQSPPLLILPHVRGYFRQLRLNEVRDREKLLESDANVKWYRALTQIKQLGDIRSAGVTYSIVTDCLYSLIRNKPSVCMLMQQGENS